MIGVRGQATKRKSLWHNTGWKCATGHIIEMSINLPAGVSARVHRHDKGYWQYGIRRGYPEKMVGRYKNRDNAMRACEQALAIDLKSAVRLLDREIGARR